MYVLQYFNYNLRQEFKINCHNISCPFFIINTNKASIKMRTRRQVRTFGQDITNIEQQANLLIFGPQDKHRPQKKVEHKQSECQSVSVMVGHQRKRSKDKEKERGKGKGKVKGWDGLGLEDRLDEIVLFGNRYYQDILKENSYVSSFTTPSSQPQPKPPTTLFPNSPQLTPQMRNILLDWLIEVHHKLTLRYETLFLTVSLIDNYCSRKNIGKAEYQLLAMASLFIAGKYEEVATPRLRKIVGLCDRLYEAEDVLRMESEILLEFGFRISQPSINWYIGLFLYTVQSDHLENPNNPLPAHSLQKYKRTCNYLSQLVLFQLPLVQKYLPYILAISILYTLSLDNEFIGVDVKECLRILNAQELKLVRECSVGVRKVFGGRGGDRFRAVNGKYEDIGDMNVEGVQGE